MPSAAHAAHSSQLLAYFAAFAALCAGYFLSQNYWQLAEHRVWFKCAPIVCLLAASAHLARADLKRRHVLALVFSLCGDVALALHRLNLAAGSALFGVAHLLYLSNIFVLVPRFDMHYRKWAAPVACWHAAMLLLSRGSVVWHDGAMIVLLVLYGGLLTYMLVAAVSAYQHRPDRATLCQAAGFLLFFASDSSLIVNVFHAWFDRRHALVMSTYYGAQWLIFAGSLPAAVLGAHAAGAAAR